MKVLADTCVWSEVLRRRRPNEVLTVKVKDLVFDGRLAIIGPIRQELLSGISDPKQFHQVKGALAAFEDVSLETAHFEKAAEFSNICRKKGIQGAGTDFLICAVSDLERMTILTTDVDFNNYRKYLPINVIQ